MIFVLSPSKALDFEAAPVVPALSEPEFATQSAELVDVLRKYSAQDLAQLMGLSKTLAELNFERFQVWKAQGSTAQSKPALLAFNGGVYAGLDAPTLPPADLAWSHNHLAILSGLYGVLRPLDQIQPYRLEMGTTLPNSKGRNLYEFWGDTLAQYLDHRLDSEHQPLVVNLASQEYFQAISTKALRAPVLHCVFEDWKNTEFKVIGVLAKRARGLMARFAIKHRITDPQDLQNFNSEGYVFHPEVSDQQRWVFRRRRCA